MDPYLLNLDLFRYPQQHDLQPKHEPTLNTWYPGEATLA